MSRVPIWVLAVVAVLGVSFTGCAKQQNAAVAPPAGATTPSPVEPPVELEGTIQVSGAFALYPLMVQWADEFGALHPKVRIDVSAGGRARPMRSAGWWTSG